MPLSVAAQIPKTRELKAYPHNMAVVIPQVAAQIPKTRELKAVKVVNFNGCRISLQPKSLRQGN